ncbi:hypothetical protein [Dactylosporangium sp. CA-092794]|uniref:hypothetical protein n=1 Tax=Dactylosporangium sp. CA-092794 TaxID=3239929 RepID=UPI003D8A94DE
MTRRIGAALALASALTACLAGCGALPGAGGNGTATPATAPATIVNLPEDTVYLPGEAVNPSAGLTTGAPVRGPIASLSPLPSRTASTASPGPRPDECSGTVRTGVVNGADVVPGTNSAVVSWWNIGDPAIVDYQLATVPQDLYYGPQPAWTWQTVAPGTGCTRVSATVTGLTSGAPYVFVVHALLRKYESLPPVAPEVARSSAVRML